MKKFLLIAVLSATALISSAYMALGPTPSTGKSLAFPVWGKKAKVGSFWGAERDGGKRSHEGIDIFARKGTPVVAVANGRIVKRANTPRGGKVLWLQVSDGGWTAYYAHLDQQKVKQGQYVRKGQVIGTVGNTGNAKTTPPHLHFGIYTWRGPINPYPIVKNSPRVTKPVSTSKSSQDLAAKKGRRTQQVTAAM